MSFTFWETIGGQRLAHCLEANLPALVDALQPKQQYIIKGTGKKAIVEDIAEAVEKGDRFIALLESGDSYVAVMEK